MVHKSNDSVYHLSVPFAIITKMQASAFIEQEVTIALHHIA
jgi:hypothetical protein